MILASNFFISCISIKFDYSDCNIFDAINEMLLEVSIDVQVADNFEVYISYVFIYSDYIAIENWIVKDNFRVD